MYSLFICVVVNDAIVTGPDVIRSLLFIVTVVHDVNMEPCGCQGFTMALILWVVFEFEFW